MGSSSYNKAPTEAMPVVRMAGYRRTGVRYSNEEYERFAGRFDRQGEQEEGCREGGGRQGSAERKCAVRHNCIRTERQQEGWEMRSQRHNDGRGGEGGTQLECLDNCVADV